MRRFLYGLALILSVLSVCPKNTYAQSGFVTVQGQVLDPNGIAYTSCQMTVSYVPSPSATTIPTIGGSAFPTSYPAFTCDSFGNIPPLALPDNNLIQDGHTSNSASLWRFNVCSAPGRYPGPQYCFNTALTITGGTQNVTSALQAAAATLPAPAGTGTVTRVSTNCSNGISCSVSSPTTTPIININGSGSGFMVKPPTSAAILIVNTDTGSDSNDGLSPGTAMLTVLHAMCSLPNGNCSTQTAGSGEVDCYGTCEWDAASDSFALMMNNDVNYASPPTGWLATSGAGIKLKCVGGSGYDSTNPQHPGGSCLLQAGSGTPSAHKPWIWLSGLSFNLEVDGFISPYDAIDLLTGTDSNGVKHGGMSPGTGSGAQNVWIHNSSFRMNSVSGAGPTMDLGPSTFWVYLDHDIVYGNINPTAITLAASGASVTSNVATYTFASSPITAGFVIEPTQVQPQVTISGFTGGDTYFNQTCVPTADTSTTMTCPLTHANGTASSTGTVTQAGLYSVAGCGILLDSTATGFVHHIFLEDSQGYLGDVCENHGASTTAEITIHDYQDEDNTIATLWAPPDAAPMSQVVFTQAEKDDSGLNSPPVLNQNCSDISVEAASGTITWPVGCAGIVGILNGAGNLVYSPQSQKWDGGSINQHVIGESLAAKYPGSPTHVQYTNVAAIPSTWYGGNQCAGSAGTFTTGVADKDGGTNAVTASCNSAAGPGQPVFYTNSSPSIATGAWLLTGVWAKSTTSNGFAGNAATTVQLSTGQLSYSTGWILGQNEWKFVWNLTQANGPSSGFNWFGNIDATHTASYYCPVAITMPASLSTDEAWQIAQNLIPYSPSASAGQLWDCSGQIPHTNAAQTWTAAQTLPEIIAGGTAAALTGTGACLTADLTTQLGGAWSGSVECTNTTGASTLIITPGATAPHGWSCTASDLTTSNALRQSVSSTTACTIAGTVNANDVITFTAIAF